MKLRSIVFAVTLVAGILAGAAPPAAAEDTACVFMDGRVSSDTFEFFECGDEVLADEVATVTEEFRQETATASHQHSLTFAPPDDQGNVHLSAAEAVGDASSSVSGQDQGGASSSSDFDVVFEIPEGQTGSVSATISAETSGEAPDDPACVPWVLAEAFMRLRGPVHDERAGVGISDEAPISESDSFEAADLPPGQYSVDVGMRTLANKCITPGQEAVGASAHFELTITVESVCENEFTDGPDIITGTPDDDFLCGGAGNDSIEGLGGNDIITGGAGSDSITGGDGLDTIEGGDDDDFIEGGPLRDIISGGSGNDGDDTAPISGGGGPDDIDGGDGIDHISGGDDDDTIDGGGGTIDFLNGDLGDDTIDSSATNSFLRGCNDTDPLCDVNQADLDAAGVTDKDILRATGQGGSLMFGGSAKDNLFGDAGSDELHGGRGDDFFDGGGSRDLLFGDQGDDFMMGGPGHESGTSPVGDPRAIFGGPGDDDIFGGPGDDLMEGEGGKDELFGAEGSDKLRGQDGNDCLTGGTRKDVLAGGADNDRLFARDGVHDVVNGGPQFDRARVDGADRLIRVENDNFQGGCP